MAKTDILIGQIFSNNLRVKYTKVYTKNTLKVPLYQDGVDKIPCYSYAGLIAPNMEARMEKRKKKKSSQIRLLSDGGPGENLDRLQVSR